MPRLVTSLPKLRRHASGQAFVQVGSRPLYLGKYGTAAARLAYDNFLQQWIAAGRPSQISLQREVTINQLVLQYWRSCKPTLSRGELQPMKSALRILRRSYGDEPVSAFGPKKLKSVRQKMITQGWVRKSINKHIHRIRRAFRWGVTEEMVPAEVWQALLSLPALREGESGVAESEPVLPVADKVIERTLPHLPGMVAAMVRVQRLIGCRPDEVCQLRPCDLDRSVDVWRYRPVQHKTKWRGKHRVILIGPRAQAILMPYLDVPPGEYCFSPARGELARRQLQHERRKTPLGYGNRPGTNRKPSPVRTAGDRYTVQAYARAIKRACEVASQMPKHLRSINPKATPEEKAELRQQAAEWRAEHCWSPNRLRHTAGTEIRKTHGVEAALVILGHGDLRTTEIYAERDLEKAAKIMRELG